MPRLPLMLDLHDRRVLLVGGGPVTARRVGEFVRVGARVEVVSPRVTPELHALADAGALRWTPREFRPGDVRDAWLVHTATGVPDVDAAVARGCEELRIWCVRADDAGASSAWSMASAQGADGIEVAVSGGRDPGRARAIRDAVAALLDTGELPVRRSRIRRDGVVGRVALVGGGPGDPGLITVRGRHLLARADVVVVDRLAPLALLEDIDDDVLVIDVGKQPLHHPIPQDEINALLVQHALEGKLVVRLKGGDPYVLGRGGEEVLACAAAGVSVEVVPGVTSAISVPASAGIPVTHRGVATSFVVASAHDASVSVLGAIRDAPHDATLVLLMGVTRLGETADGLIRSGRDPRTPVAVIERGWTSEQRTTTGTLETIAAIAESVGVRSPAVTVIGAVVGFRESFVDAGAAR